MNSVERAAPEPSQGGSSLEAKLDEQDRLNVPRLLLNGSHSLPQLGFGVWQIDNAEAEIIGTAIHAGYRLIDTAASGTQRIPRPRAHPPARRRRRSGRDVRRQRRIPGPPQSPRPSDREPGHGVVARVAFPSRRQADGDETSARHRGGEWGIAARTADDRVAGEGPQCRLHESGHLKMGLDGPYRLLVSLWRSEPGSSSR